MKEPEQSIAPQWALLRGLFSFETALNLFAPYLGAGISIRAADPAYRFIEVQMRETPFNRNYVGSHFGGSLYSMCDPFYMFILMERLGADYIVWDKAARIDFLRPGHGTVTARFEVSETEAQAIREKTARERKTDWEFTCSILDEQGREVAKVWKLLYIRRRRKPAAGAG